MITVTLLLFPPDIFLIDKIYKKIKNQNVYKYVLVSGLHPYKYKYRHGGE